MNKDFTEGYWALVKAASGVVEAPTSGFLFAYAETAVAKPNKWTAKRWEWCLRTLETHGAIVGSPEVGLALVLVRLPLEDM